MRTVHSGKYNADYFTNTLAMTKSLVESGGTHIHETIANLLALHENDTVIDFGCGAGPLSFLLNKKFHCKVIGIDYSADAIALCQQYNQNLSIDDVSFLCSGIENLPILENIKAVYMGDVVEHLYDEQLDELFMKMREWARNRQRIAEEFYVVVHTDNLHYLNYARPFLDIINLISRRVSFEQLHERNRFEKDRHVNLTTAARLNKRFLKYGYLLEKIEYPAISEERLRIQLGYLGEFKLSAAVIKKIYPILKYMSPSFYALYRKISAD